MKRTTVVGGVVVVAAAAAGGYYLMRPTATPETVKNPVDVQYEELCIQLNDLDAKVQQPDANLDSLTLVLKSVKWTPVKAGDKYETQKRNLYLDTKKNVAMTFRKAYQDQGQDISNAFLDDVEAISE